MAATLGQRFSCSGSLRDSTAVTTETTDLSPLAREQASRSSRVHSGRNLIDLQRAVIWCPLLSEKQPVYFAHVFGLLSLRMLNVPLPSAMRTLSLPAFPPSLLESGLLSFPVQNRFSCLLQTFYSRWPKRDWRPLFLKLPGLYKTLQYVLLAAFAFPCRSIYLLVA